VQISSLVKKSLMPLVVASCIVAAVSGAGLISMGQWRTLLPIVLFFPFSFFVFPILLFPAAFFSGMMQVLEHNEKPAVARVMLGLSLGWLVFAMSLFTAIVFYLMAELISHEQMRLSAATWAVSAVIATWSIFATRDRDNVFFTGLVMMLAVAASIAAWRMTLSEHGFWQIMLTIFLPFVLMLAAQGAAEKIIYKKPPPQ
jgi:hypothetical protein